MEINYEDLKLALEKLGLRVEKGDRRDLVQVDNGGLFECVDGREPEDQISNGPKFPGGVEGVAWFIARNRGADNIEERDVQEAITRVRNAGWTPGVHDMHEDPHCGHMAKVMEGAFSVGTNVDPDRLGEMVVDAGGGNIHLHGSHQETRVNINLVPGTTRVANESDEAFHVDVWAAKILGIDPMELINHSAKTVELLKPEAGKIIRIYA